MNFEIRRARPEEHRTCAELYDRVAQATFTWFAFTDLRAGFLEALAEEDLYVAASPDGRILGLASFFAPDDFLHSLYVDHGLRGQGVGLALLNHIHAIAKGPVSLKVQVLNHRARRFYAREGYKVIDGGGEPWPSRDRWLRVGQGQPADAPSPAPTVRISRARPNDLAAAARLYAWIAERNFAWEPPEARTAATKMASFEDQAVWVARERGMLNGFVALTPETGFVHSLFVEPQGAGVGPALLATAREAAGMPLTLRCAELNAAGLRFYHHQGFREIARETEHGHVLILLRGPD